MTPLTQDTFAAEAARRGVILHNPALSQKYNAITDGHLASLKGFVRRKVRTDEEADDVIQEALLLGCRYIGQFRFEASLSTWLQSIANNVIRGRWRRRQSSWISFVDPGTLEWLDKAVSHSSPLIEMERNEVSKRLHKAIAKLPASYRIVIELRELQGLSLRQTAERLSTSIPAIKSRGFRAKAMLRDLMTDGPVVYSG